jgi:hypothetical protein
MSVVGPRPWTAHEDIVLQRLAAAGKYVAAIAIAMNRSESAIRSHAALLNLTLAKGQRGPKAKAKGETKPGTKPKSPKSKWYVSFQSYERAGKRTHILRTTETFQNEQEAKAFARAKLAEGSNINAGTLNPLMPKRTIASIQILDWLNEPSD